MNNILYIWKQIAGIDPLVKGYAECLSAFIYSALLILGTMKLIKLTRGLSAQVDDSDYWLNAWKWYALKGKKTYYAARHTSINGKRKILYMHRIIMDTPDDQEVDHQDHNGLHCERHNMRNATHSQNRMNKEAWGTSKYLGVSIKKNGGYIESRIKVNGKTIHLGNSKTEEEAARKYDKAANQYHGEFANLNFKDEFQNI